jgi:hypothetical protein
MAKILEFKPKKPKKPSHIKTTQIEPVKLLKSIKLSHILLTIICIFLPPIGLLILVLKHKQLGYIKYFVIPPLLFYSIIYCIILGNYILVQLHIQ